jgi:hypothetical protein
MKKIMSILVVGLMSSGLSGAEFNDTQTKELIGFIKDALLEQKDSLNHLESFVNLNREALEKNDKAVLKNLRFPAKSMMWSTISLEKLFDVLDPRLFVNKERVMQLLGVESFKKAPPRKEKSLERAVADVVAKALDDKEGIDHDLLAHAYNKKPIDTRLYYYEKNGQSSELLDREDTLSKRLDFLVNYYTDAARAPGAKPFFGIEVPPYLTKIQLLTSGMRQGDCKGVVEFNEQRFGMLVLDCLFYGGKKYSSSVHFDNLKAFVEKNRALLPSIDELYFNEDITLSRDQKKYLDLSIANETMSLGQFLDAHDPLIFKVRDPLLKLLGRAIPARAADQKEKARTYVVTALKRYLGSLKTDRSTGFLDGNPSGALVESLFERFPLCIDEVDYDGVRSLGRALDHKRVVTMSLGFGPYRKKGAELTEEGSVFIDLLLCCLMHEGPEEMHKDLATFVFGYEAGSISRKVPDKNKRRTEKTPFYWDNTFESVTYGDFFDQMNPALFPCKRAVEQAAFGRTKKGQTYTQEADQKFIENVLRASLHNPLLGELFSYVCAQYEELYGTHLTLEGNKIPFRSETVSDYLAQCTDSKLTKQYKSFLPKKLFKAVTSRKHPEQEQQKQAENDQEPGTTITIGKDVEWGKLFIGTAVVSIAGYIWYSSRKNSSSNAVQTSQRAQSPGLRAA